eukprot:5475-Heterococcus_DN1.PRE.4
MRPAETIAVVAVPLAAVAAATAAAVEIAHIPTGLTVVIDTSKWHCISTDNSDTFVISVEHTAAAAASVSAVAAAAIVSAVAAAAAIVSAIAAFLGPNSVCVVSSAKAMLSAISQQLQQHY